VNPPTGTESDEIILATWGVSAAGPSAVGIWESEVIACPQDRQNLLSAGIWAEHFGHSTIGVGVIGFWRTPLIICDPFPEGKHVDAGALPGAPTQGIRRGGRKAARPRSCNTKKAQRRGAETVEIEFMISISSAFSAVRFVYSFSALMPGQAALDL
jgi:hypothetical protein